MKQTGKYCDELFRFSKHNTIDGQMPIASSSRLETLRVITREPQRPRLKNLCWVSAKIVLTEPGAVCVGSTGFTEWRGGGRPSMRARPRNSAEYLNAEGKTSDLGEVYTFYLTSPTDRKMVDSIA